jgi:integrase/recombinase XerC
MNSLSGFIDYLKYEKRGSLNTVISYTTDLEQFFAYLEQKFQITDIKDIDSKIIRTWIITLVEEGLSARSINRKISSLKSFFKYHNRIKTITHNPTKQITSPKIAKRLPEFVAQEDMEHLFNEDLFANTYEGWRDRVIIELFYSTGMRLSELINLKFQDIDFYEKSIKVLGKRNKERIIPLGNIAIEALQKYLLFFENKFGESKKYFHIFVTSKANKIYPKAVYIIVRKYLDMVTTIDKRSPHVIRHTFATHLLNNGADINAIKEILGHSSLAATQVYTHNSIDKLKAIYKQAHPRA